MLKFNLTVALGALLLLAPGAASADCKLLKIAEFHLDPAYRSPVIDGAINGAPIKILIDSGAGFSMVHSAAADRFALPRYEVPGARAYGIGGSTKIEEAHIKELKIGDLVKKDMDLEVAGDPNEKWSVSLVLGADFLAQVDIEFDLPDNAIRLFRHVDCKPPQLVYWGAAYSQATLLPWDWNAPQLQTMALINGHSILAELDSGAQSSLIDSGTASAAGAQDTAASTTIRGLGAAPEPVQIVRLDSFALGDEKISNVRVEAASLKSSFNYSETGSIVPRRLGSAPSMLVGADFFRSHRLYFDTQDHLILFSYAGGPVFVTPPAKPATTTPAGK